MKNRETTSPKTEDNNLPTTTTIDSAIEAKEPETPKTSTTIKETEKESFEEMIQDMETFIEETPTTSSSATISSSAKSANGASQANNQTASQSTDHSTEKGNSHKKKNPKEKNNNREELTMESLEFVKPDRKPDPAKQLILRYMPVYFPTQDMVLHQSVTRKAV